MFIPSLAQQITGLSNGKTARTSLYYNSWKKYRQGCLSDFALLYYFCSNRKYYLLMAILYD